MISAKSSTENDNSQSSPSNGHTKHNRGFDRFHRRGRLAVRTEWRLITMSHNLTKLHRHQIAALGVLKRPPAGPHRPTSLTHHERRTHERQPGPPLNGSTRQPPRGAGLRRRLAANSSRYRDEVVRPVISFSASAE